LKYENYADNSSLVLRRFQRQKQMIENKLKRKILLLIFNVA
jgi:hypothetical protein